MDAMEVKGIIEAALPGAEVNIRDDTHKHEDHNADVGHFGSHFLVKIVWDGFAGMARLERHRKVQDALAGPWAQREIHSLSLRLMTTAEAAA